MLPRHGCIHVAICSISLDISLTVDLHIIFQLSHNVKATSGTRVGYSTSSTLTSAILASRCFISLEANKVEMSAKLELRSTVVLEVAFTVCESSDIMQKLSVRKRRSRQGNHLLCDCSPHLGQQDALPQPVAEVASFKASPC